MSIGEYIRSKVKEAESMTFDELLDSEPGFRENHERLLELEEHYKRLERQGPVSCNEAANYIIQNGKYLSSYSTFTSSWIKSTDAYQYNNSLYIFIHTRQNNSYIYCDVPYNNWQFFISNGYSTSYGQRFHKYIEPYKCNCR